MIFFLRTVGDSAPLPFPVDFTRPVLIHIICVYPTQPKTFFNQDPGFGPLIVNDRNRTRTHAKEKGEKNVISLRVFYFFIFIFNINRL